jgi:hypothetical protein
LSLQCPLNASRSKWNSWVTSDAIKPGEQEEIRVQMHLRVEGLTRK